MTKYFILSTSVFFFSGLLTAQETSKSDTIRTLQEIIISYQADKQTPVTFLNIYAKEIEAKSLGQEPSFLLAETPSVTNYSDAGNSQGYSYFRLRGIDQTRINFTLDGVPLNEPEDQGVYFSNYPDLFNSVSRVQIQRGVGTSKNGTASYGGSVQLFSPNLADSAKTSLGLGYGSFNSLRVFAEHNSGVNDGKAFYVRASQVYSDGFKDHSSNNSQSVFLSGGLFQKKSMWKLNFLAGHQQNDLAWLGVSDSLINNDRRTNGNSRLEKDRFFQTLSQLKNLWEINRSSSVETSIYHSYLEGNYDFDFNNFLGLPSTDELYNYSFQSHLAGFFTNYTFSKNRLNFTSGTHGNIYNRQHTGSERTLGQLYQNTGYKNEVSIFTKGDYTIGHFTFFADLQSRSVNFDYRGSANLEKLNWHFINPKAGLSAAVNDRSTFYYSVGYTGREPTRNDMFAGNDDLLADTLGNGILSNTEAEYILNHELGVRFQADNLTFNTNLYHMDFRNEIVLDGKFGPNGLALTNNVEQSFRTGLEFGIVYRLNSYLSLVNNSSVNFSRIKEQTEVFSPILTPPIIINQEAVFTKSKVSIAFSGRYQHHSFIDFANAEQVNGYFLFNSRAAYSTKDFQFSLFLGNITNSRYFNQGYVDIDGSKKFFVQAPTNLYASIQYSF